MFLLICFLIVLCPLLLGGARDVLIWFWLPYIGMLGLIATLQRDRQRELIQWPFFSMVSFSLIPLTELGRLFIGGAFKGAGALDQVVLHLNDLQFIRMLNPFHPINASMIFIAHLVFFWVCVATFSRKHQWPIKFLRVSAVATALFAAYGIVANELFPDNVLWFSFPDTTPGVRSSFVNRNNYAAFAGLGLLASVLWVRMSLIQTPSEPTNFHPQRALNFAEAKQGTLLPALTCLLLNTGGLMLSGSRGGIVSCLFASCTLMFMLHRSGPKRLYYFAAGGLIILGIGITSDLFISRLEWNSDSFGHRLELLNTMASIVSSSLYTGIGLGNTEQAFRLVANLSDYYGHFRRGHNDLMELLLGGGIICFIAAILCLVSLLRSLWLRYLNFSIDNAALAFCAIIQITIHSLVDFPFQIPGISFALTAILALGFTSNPNKNSMRMGSEN